MTSMSLREARQLVAEDRRARAAEQRKLKAARAPKNRVDHKPAKPDRGRERDNGFLAFLRRQPCAASGLGGCGGRIDPAHLRFGTPDRPNPGMGRKNHDKWCNPVCRTHHDLQHSMKEQAFWALVGVDPAENAARLFAIYRGPNA